MKHVVPALFLTVVVGLVFTTTCDAVPAFPGAEGAGANSQGGRGGRVIEVTNTADHGPGSLRAAIDAPGARTIVFRVAGTIKLESDLKIATPFITIAGQTAPGGGITLRDYPLIIEANHVVVRYLRVRLGNESATQSDAISVVSGTDVILDHVSAGWSVDETLSVSPGRSDQASPLDRVTVQWSIISESLNHSVHVKGDHGYGSLIRGSHGAQYSFHHNLWAHHRARMPRPGNYESPADDPVGPLFDFRNNVFYNWGGSYSGYNADSNSRSRYNFVANYYLRGANSDQNSIAFEEGSSGAQAFFADNVMDGIQPADAWSLVRIKSPAIDVSQYRAPDPFATAAITNESATDAYAHVLDRAGNRCMRDAVDIRVIKSVRERSGQLINSQIEVGGWPELKTAKPYVDADHDGISDEWERRHRLNPRNAKDAGTKSQDGYTFLEQFLNELAQACEAS